MSKAGQMTPGIVVCDFLRTLEICRGEPRAASTPMSSEPSTFRLMSGNSAAEARRKCGFLRAAFGSAEKARLRGGEGVRRFGQILI